jgi:hypothetical protein
VLGIDTSAYTIVAVADIGGASGYLCSADDANDAAQIYRVAGNVAFSSQFLPSTASISGAGAANPNVIVAIGNGASSKIFVSAKTAAATGNAGTHDLTGNAHTIGNYQNSVAGTFAMGGSLAQFLIYERALSDLEVGNILDYFGSLHGITIGA